MLKTKSVYAPADPGDGIRMLVTRFYPRGVKREHFHEWNRDLAPSARLLAQYKSAQISPDKFVELFRSEMNADVGRQAIASLMERAAVTDITILCYEPEGELCHRHIICDMVAPPGPTRKGHIW